MFYEVLIGLRYLKNRRSSGYLSFISIASMLGITLGVAALIVVMSVMDGFQTNIRNKILVSSPHLQVSTNEETMSDWLDVLKTGMDVDGVESGAPYIEERGMVYTDPDHILPIRIKGINPDFEPLVTNFGTSTTAIKNMKPGQFEIVLSENTAKQWKLNVGDKVSLMTSKYSVTPGGILPRMKQFKIIGLLTGDSLLHSANTVYIHIHDLNLFAQTDIRAIQFKLINMDNAVEIEKILNSKLDYKYKVSSWATENSVLFEALTTEKIMMMMVLMLIIVVALFNVIAILMMTVLNKSSEIAILKTIGASNQSIKYIFMIQGMFISVSGTILGILLGLLISMNMDIVSAIMINITGTQLPENMRYALTVPVQFNVIELLLLCFSSIGLGFIITLYPSSRAAKIHPAEALRYE